MCCLILRPLAGCDDLSVIKAKNPKEICSYVPLRGVIRENDMWRVIDHEICSYVPLRGVISISGSTKTFHGEVGSYVPLRGVILNTVMR